MAFSSSDLSTVETAIVSGVKVGRVTVNGKTIEYRSLDELLRLRDLIRDEVAAASAISGARRVSTTLKSDTW